MPMPSEWVIAAYNEGASKPFAVFHADWASRDYSSGRVEFFKSGRLIDEVTLERSETLAALPFNF
jgi:hypothetical protein